jgi:hypothetical protein
MCEFWKGKDMSDEIEEAAERCVETYCNSVRLSKNETARDLWLHGESAKRMRAFARQLLTEAKRMIAERGHRHDVEAATDGIAHPERYKAMLSAYTIEGAEEKVKQPEYDRLKSQKDALKATLSGEQKPRRMINKVGLWLRGPNFGEGRAACDHFGKHDENKNCSKCEPPCQPFEEQPKEKNHG